jgi:hypothetical protein
MSGSGRLSGSGRPIGAPTVEGTCTGRAGGGCTAGIVSVGAL